ncbi:heat shock factor-binding protein-like [Papaver somniferum]|uniref:heat shock factor-binding protein-like n=1 Tax=Papaver somniferum TaxID=3469 RepID=UPI000E705832|nr:heat shock factor-binding protein-like [Papaver somniferum]XP_026454002.1 heat shock factor-binding protein-like [Papaver somniferum]
MKNDTPMGQPGFTTPGGVEHEPASEGTQSPADMTVFVQSLLQQMQSRFQQMSNTIVSKIDEMGNRIDELEQSINELRTEMGAEGSPSPLPGNSKSEAVTPGDEPK